MPALSSALRSASACPRWGWCLLLVVLCGGLLLGGCNRKSRTDLAVVVATATPAAARAAVPAATPTAPSPQVLADQFATAVRLERNGLLDDADVAYRQLAMMPSSDVAWRAAFALSRLRHGRGQWAQAEQSLNRFFALADSPQFAPDPETTASAYWFRAEALKARRAWEDATHAYDIALAGLPDLTVHILRQMGQMWVDAGAPDRGLPYLERAAQAAPDPQTQVQIRQQMASIQETQGNFLQAADMYDAILAVSQNGYYRAQIHYLAGMVLLQANAEERAIAHFREATAAERRSLYAYLALVELVNREEEFDSYNRGYIDYHAGAYSLALAAFTTYWESADPEDFRLPWSLLYAGHAHFKLENYVQALDHYRRITTHYPECECRGAAWNGLLNTYFAVGNDTGYAQAWADFRAALPTDPHVALILFQSGYALLAQGKRAEAASDLLDLVALFPDDSRAPQALFDLAMDALQHGDGNGANRFWDQLRTQYPWYRAAAVSYWSGRNLWAMDDPAAAQFAWQHAQRNHPETFYGLAAAQAARQADGTSQDMIPDISVLAGAAALLPGDDGSRTFTVNWLHSWVEDPAAIVSAATRLDTDVDWRQAVAYLRLGLRTQARSHVAALLPRYTQDAGVLLHLVEQFASLRLYYDSIQAARHLYYLAPAPRVAELPLYIQYYLFPRHYADLVRLQASQHTIPELLFYSLIRQESLFDPRAVSSLAAQGLSQVIPDTGEWIAMRTGMPDYRHEMLALPWLNLQFGAYYLRYVYEDVDRNWLTALVSYNAGPGTSHIYRQQAGTDDLLFLVAIPVAEPVTYVEAVVTNLYHYTRLYG